MVINSALLKYGHENFSLTILEYCDIEDVLEREQFYFDTLKPEYNVLPLAGSRGGYCHTAESKLKMSELRKGKLHSEETKAKLSEVGMSNTNRVGKIHTEEQRAKISAGQPTSKRLEVLDLVENTINQYNSIREVSKSIGCSRYAVSKTLENKKVLKERYMIRPCV